MTAARDLTGLIGPERTTPPPRTVTATPPRRPGQRDTPLAETTPVPPPAPTVPGTDARPARRRHHQPVGDAPASRRRHDTSKPGRPTTVRISVNIPFGCKQWLARQAREQQRFVSEIVMEALDRYGDEATPSTGRAKRVAVPDGTICNIVLPADDKQRIDDIVAGKSTTRSALLSDVLNRAAHY
jgi:hypothetical protein